MKSLQYVMENKPGRHAPRNAGSGRPANSWTTMDNYQTQQQKTHFIFEALLKDLKVLDYTYLLIRDKDFFLFIQIYAVNYIHPCHPPKLFRN